MISYENDSRLKDVFMREKSVYVHDFKSKFSLHFSTSVH